MSSAPADDWKRRTVPGVYPLTMLEIAADRGVASSVLLADAGLALTPTDIAESGLAFEDHVRLMYAIEARVGDPRVGVELGWRLPPTALGSVGHAILASATGADALAALQRFWHLIGYACAIAVDTKGETGAVEVYVHLPLTEPERVRVKEVCLVSMRRGVLALVPDAADETDAWFDFAEPSHAGYARERLGRVRYDAPSCQFRFPTRLLSRPLALSSAAGLKAAVRACEREEEERGLTDGRLIARLRSELKPGSKGYPSLDEMARRLGMAPRTLRRRLKHEGAGYAEMLEDARRSEALRLLGNQQLATHQVAQRLGYLDPANFTRAFRRWTGQTPSEYRRRVVGA